MVNNIFDNKRYQLEAKLKSAEAPEGSRVAHDPVKCYSAMKKGARLWANFSTDVNSGRDLFRRENLDRIRSHAETIDGAKSPGGAFAIALKELWETEDQTEWDTRAMSLDQSDVYTLVLPTLYICEADQALSLGSNQEEFPNLLHGTIDCLTQSKRLGNVEALCFFAFRKADGKTKTTM